MGSFHWEGQYHLKETIFFGSFVFVFVHCYINENLCTDYSIYNMCHYFILVHAFQRSNNNNKQQQQHQQHGRFNENSANISTTILRCPTPLLLWLLRNTTFLYGKVKTSSDNICVSFWPVAKFIDALAFCTNLDKFILSLEFVHISPIHKPSNEQRDRLQFVFFIIHYTVAVI